MQKIAPKSMNMLRIPSDLKKTNYVQMKIFINIYFLLFLVVYSTTSVYGQKTIKLDPERMLKGNLQLSDIVESIEYIPLETCDKCLLETIISSRFVISGNNILINSQNTMYLFNRSGKFIAQIGRVGQGPGEYLKFHASPLFIDETNKKVIIYTFYPNRMMYFDFNGRFDRSVPINMKEGLKIWVNDRILSMDAVQFQPDFTYRIYDSNFQPIANRIRPLRINRPDPAVAGLVANMPAGGPFAYYLFNDRICIRESVLNDTLYMVDLKSLSFVPKYIIDEGKYAFTSDIIFETNAKSFFDRSKNCTAISTIFETKDFLFTKYKPGGYSYYSKKQEQFFSLNSSGIPNDYDGGPDFWPIYQKNNELIGFYDAYLFADNVNKLKPKGPQKTIDQVKKIIEEIDPEDNPIMVVVKLKQ